MTVEMLFMCFVQIYLAVLSILLTSKLYFLWKNSRLKRKDFFWAVCALGVISAKPIFMLAGEGLFFFTGNSYIAGLVYKMHWQFSSVWFAVANLLFIGEFLQLEIMKNQRRLNFLAVVVVIFSAFYEFGTWNLNYAHGGILDSIMNAYARDVMLALQGALWLITFFIFTVTFLIRIITVKGEMRFSERYKGIVLLVLVGIMIPLTDIPVIFGNVYNTYFYYIAYMWMTNWIIFYYLGIKKIFTLK